AIDHAKPIIESLREGRGDITPDTPLLGVTTVPLESVEEAVKDRLQIRSEQGAFVVDVTPGSGADEAGIRQGDVIVGADGEEITEHDGQGGMVGDKDPGDSLDLAIEREGERQTIAATTGRKGG